MSNPLFLPSSVRVLVVDDHPDLLSMLDLVMQRRKYAVKTAQSADEAIKMATDFAPHIVVSDIGMPGMDGYQLMAHLRAAPDMAPFKSIALTGYDISTEDNRAMTSGYDAHMTKPIEFEQLFEMIENLVCDMQKEEWQKNDLEN
ncbi:MAG TPA: response regulator [Abditibacterium sp.]|jgi:CheY-like chemotaxis protein